MIKNLPKFKTYWAVLLIVPLVQLPSFSQTANIQTGNSQRLSITLSNTMGVSTSANVNENLSVINEANLELLDGTIIEEQVGDDTASVTGNFGFNRDENGDINGGSIDIQGLKAYNKYLIGEESFFYSKMETVPEEEKSTVSAIDPVTGLEVKYKEGAQGNASSNLNHSMTIVIDQTNSSFTSSFSQAF